MRFPLRLSADLFRAQLSGRFAGAAAPPIFRLSLLAAHSTAKSPVDESSTDLEWHSPEQCVRLTKNLRAPVVWLSGADPLLHPQIGGVASSLVRAGRHVFLHTSACDMRKRIHEFEPVSRLFLTVELVGLEPTHDRCTQQPGAFRGVLEALRAAKLSGFLVCGHVTVTLESDPAEMGELFEVLDAKDVDGFVVSSGGAHSDAPTAAAIRVKLEEVRGLIRCGPWERFSRLLESSYAAPAALAVRPALRGNEPDACEESA